MSRDLDPRLAIVFAILFALVGGVGLKAALGWASISSIPLGFALLALWRWLPRQIAATILMLFVFVAIGAFLTMAACESNLGGTAGNGKIEQGRYFLGTHGSYREVSEKTYRLVMIPEAVVTVSWPAMFIVFAGIAIMEKQS